MKSSVPQIQCSMSSNERMTGSIVIASAFVICFTLFGVFNLIGGSVLVSVACKQQVVLERTLFHDFPSLRQQNQKYGKFWNPLMVVGPTLLITGMMLVIVGFLLGIVACRSSTHLKKSLPYVSSLSCVQMSSLNGKNPEQETSKDRSATEITNILINHSEKKGNRDSNPDDHCSQQKVVVDIHIPSSTREIPKSKEEPRKASMDSRTTEETEIPSLIIQDHTDEAEYSNLTA
ncbi:uncharacterized protein LOC111086604 [Limulus polyphemus]|uniref:Uncharacterized protein LOC111086604 n=1 Tax=Limulus polyphemus TaxID=6850 RepID=A0ABM1SQB7_LIMPO|nr:uncharacterized protein LOC111086604 [Limulus polyphemus]